MGDSGPAAELQMTELFKDETTDVLAKSIEITVQKTKSCGKCHEIMGRRIMYVMLPGYCKNYSDSQNRSELGGSCQSEF
ncbi:hypothetical protein CAEBREN_10679 [Caenorhabditis brenneri]|uniref:Uncharacterized protein n=1 Tax=Caenorhabditis brenneri TaxID=135651 RepID=G0P2K0_CAEBE|nr:hypothetical protein CAEBREN_10679 [Caenorhabditis brenneri]